MAESSWPLPPNAVVSDLQYEQLLMGYVPSGVVGSPGDTTIITAPGSGTRIITVRLGKFALVRGHLWSSGTSDVNLASLAANASGNPRIDLVVIRYTRSGGAVTVAVITGTPAASPVAPSPVQSLGTSSTFDLPIAEVAVASGATTITTGNITTRETYLSRTPMLGTAVPTPTTVPGVYIGQTYDQYSSAGVYIQQWWWTGAAWRVRGMYRDVQLGTGASSFITFSNIPTYLRTIRIDWTARSDLAAAFTTFGIRPNGDSGANYRYSRVNGNANGSTPATVTAVAVTSSEVGAIPAASTTAGVYGGGTITINGWASPHASFLTGTAHAGYIDNAVGNSSDATYSWAYVGAGPYSSLSFLTNGNFLTGSEFHLTGWD